jgi:poly-gamma-glutamate synthesis protein (capsule biosynthesis protein)
MRIFLAGDVMLGRGLDQALPDPCEPEIHEAYINSALDYVRLAERASGSIARPMALRDPWGVSLEELQRARPDLRIVNLETSITRSNDYQPKGINYRVSPQNARCLTVAGIDCCALANNHMLDWGRRGLLETLRTLDGLGIGHAGAGSDAAASLLPAVLDRPDGGRLLLYSAACESSGVGRDWAATAGRSGVNLLRDLSEDTASRFADRIAGAKHSGDVVIVSIHWGPNWGYEITEEQRRFAHALIDRAGVAIVHGHSSHHAKAIEVHARRLVLHGCGDFLNDYEGIDGYQEYRGDLAVMYFADVEVATGRLVELEMVPLQIRQFQLQHPSHADIDWLARTLDRESRKFGSRIAGRDGRLQLRQA